MHALCALTRMAQAAPSPLPRCIVLLQEAAKAVNVL